MLIRHLDEGYTKYSCHHSQGSLPAPAYEALLALRNVLRQHDLIGRYPNGIGYGNVSQRQPEGFVITATQTGHHQVLGYHQLSWVTHCEPATNELWCTGPLQASSEGMTHDSIYRCLPEVRVVAHLHNGAYWQQHLHRLPTTPAHVAYGTPDMAEAVATLLAHPDAVEAGIFLTAGHEEGIFVFGPSYADVRKVLYRHGLLPSA